jgi:hypothetical protein
MRVDDLEKRAGLTGTFSAWGQFRLEVDAEGDVVPQNEAMAAWKAHWQKHSLS